MENRGLSNSAGKRFSYIRLLFLANLEATNQDENQGCVHPFSQDIRIRRSLQLPLLTSGRPSLQKIINLHKLILTFPLLRHKEEKSVFIPKMIFNKNECFYCVLHLLKGHRWLQMAHVSRGTTKFFQYIVPRQPLFVQYM